MLRDAKKGRTRHPFAADTDGGLSTRESGVVLVLM
jgi:hypothetical protein